MGNAPVALLKVVYHGSLSCGRAAPRGENGKNMKKDEEQEVEMREHYDFQGGIRGKYVERFAEDTNVVVLSPDVAAVFPDSESVNSALRLLIQIAQRSTERSAP